MDETSRREKARVLMIYSSKSIKCCFLMDHMSYSLSRFTMRTKDGDIGYSSFADINKHVTANVTKHGAS